MVVRRSSCGCGEGDVGGGDSVGEGATCSSSTGRSGEEREEDMVM